MLTPDGDVTREEHNAPRYDGDERVMQVDAEEARTIGRRVR